MLRQRSSFTPCPTLREVRSVIDAHNRWPRLVIGSTAIRHVVGQFTEYKRLPWVLFLTYTLILVLQRTRTLQFEISLALTATMLTVNGIRVFLYVLLWLFAAVLLGLTADRIHYTTHIPLGDPLNDGNNFYDPIVAELLSTSALTLLWVPWIIHVISRGNDYGLVSTFASETIGLSILFILWLVGAAISTSSWGDLNWCHQYLPCRILTAMVAFAWMGFILVFMLLLISLMFSIANRAFRQPLHGRYDPRGSGYGPTMAQRRV